MSDIFSLQDKVILITGGYGHLGGAIVEGLLDKQALVYVLGKSEEKFKNRFAEVLGKKRTLYFIKTDIGLTEDVKSAFEEVVRKHQIIDVLINNAFYLRGQNPESISDDDWQYSMEGSLNAVYRCIREVIPYMKKLATGSIINISSMYGMVAPDFDVYADDPAFLNPPNYGAAKAGVLQLSRYFASYLGRFNIRVNTVSPGPFPNQAVQEASEVFIQKLSAKTCLGRIGKPEELQGAMVFLASNASSYVTGQNLVIDGGWTNI